MAGPVVDILMYHSVSDRGGPTSIPPSVFADQMQAIADAGLPVITLDDYLAARKGGAGLAPHAIIITFDDGFQDFADAAWPVMRRLGFRPTVYLPTGFVGGAEGWRGIAAPPRRLMDWPTIRALAAQGVIFGSHTVNHPDLNALAPEALDRELDRSAAAIEAQLGAPAHHFAPPYGLAGRAVRARIAARYRTSAGTRLGQATMTAPADDLPRIEMFYFTDPVRWRRHLAGRGGGYLAGRRALRALRGALMKPWRGV